MKRAAAPRDGVATLPGHGAAPACISKLPEQRLQVALRLRTPIDLDRLLGEEVGVQFTGPLGLFRGRGALHPEDADGWIEGFTRDISGGGLLFAGRCELAVGAAVNLRSTTGADEPPIEGRARVMRITDGGCHGLAFTELASAQRQRLVRFVFECERAALQQGRR